MSDKSFIIDSNVSLVIDGEISKNPVEPLFEGEKKHLIDNFFEHYLFHFKKTVKNFRLLESHEYSEMMSNRDFMKARAFIHFSRSLNRFCKARYKKNIRVGLASHGGGIKGKINDDEISFISKNKSSRSKEFPDRIDLYGELIPGKAKDLKKYIKENPKKISKLAKLIGIKRLEMFWIVFSKDVIQKMALDTHRTKKLKGIPTRNSLKNITEKDKDKLLSNLKEARNNFSERDTPIILKEESTEELDEIKDFLNSSKLSKRAKKFLYLVKILEVESSFLNMEFGSDVLKIQEEIKRNKERKDENH